MLEYWIVVTVGVIVVIAALSVTYLYAESRELRLVRSRYRLKVYEGLLHAVTDLNVAGGDMYKLNIAKKKLAYNLNRLNLVAGEEVLKQVNELLDFLNGEESGWRITGESMEAAPVPLAAGTEIEVRDLFYNTPARRIFLRSERTEFSHLEEVVRRITLSHFELALRFSHNGKQILRVKPSIPAREGIRRVADVLGSAFAENSISLDVSAGGLRLWGWIGGNGYSRSQADIHYFYLNGRMIRDRLAGHAVRLAFGERIAEGRFPAYLLYLELDPRLVDVNVHPTKHEVRFREARQTHDFIYWAVSGTLEENKKITSGVETAPVIHQNANRCAEERFRTPLRSAVGERAVPYPPRAAKPAASADVIGMPLWRAVCQLRSGYLLAERGDTTLLVDLRAMMTELHHRRLTAQGGEALLTAQPLLIPESLNLTAEGARLWRERGNALEPYGFEFGWLGDTLLVLRKVPSLVRMASMPSLLTALQRFLERMGDNDEAARESLLQIVSSHAVSPQLPAYSLAELNALLREYEAAMPHASDRPWRELHPADWQRVFDILS